MSNRFDAMMVREYEKDGQSKSHWTKIGSAFCNKDGSISVLLDAMPLPSPDGYRVVLQIPLTQAQKDEKFGPRNGGQQQRQQQQGRGQGAQQQRPTGQGFGQPQGNQQRFGGQRPQSQPQQGQFGQGPPQPTTEYEPEFEPDPGIPF